MGIHIISQTITPELTTQPVDYLLGNVLDKIVIETEIGVSTYADSSTANNMIMNYTTGMIGPYWLYDPLGQFGDFKIGDTIEQKNNSTPFASLETGIVLLDKLDNFHIQLNVSLALASGGNDVNTSGSIFNVTSPITAVKYQFNFIENSEAVNYNSKVTSTPILLEANDIDAVTTVVPVAMAFVGAKPYQIGGATIVGDNIDNSGATYVSKFIISHTAYINPFANPQDWPDILLRNPPTYFDALDCLKYVFKFIAMFQYNDPNRQIVYENSQDINWNKQGNTGWFNENFNTGITNYTAQLPSYQNDLTSAVIPGILLDGSKTNISFAVLNTTDSPFSNNNTRFVLSVFKVPGDASEFNFNTNPLIMPENFAYDRALQTVGAAAVDGDNFGGGSQVITGLTATYNNTYSITVNFSVEMGANAIGVVALGQDHRYIIAMSVQNHTLDTDSSDKVTLLVDANEYFVDSSAPGLILFDNLLFLPHISSDFDTDGLVNFKGTIEDEVSTRYEVFVDKTNYPTDTIIITSVQSSIVMKGGGPEFILETISANTSGFPIDFTGAQAIGYSAPRVFHIPLAEGIRKNYKVNRRADLDTGLKIGYEIIYPFMCRWEDWLPLSGVPGLFYNAYFPNNNQNRNWEHYQNIGYLCYLRTTINATINGAQVSFTAPDKDFSIANYHTPVDIKTFNPVTNAPLFNAVTGQDYILSGQDTLVVATFNLGAPPILADCKVNLGIEIFGQGGSIAGSDGKRRMSSVNPSDADTWYKSYTNNDLTEVTASGNNVIAKALIDFTKIPANTEFSISGRLWANT